MSRDQQILPERDGESDEERRLREAVNRHCGQLLSTLDAAIALRTAPSSAARTRHIARGHLQDFALKAMHAQALARDRRDT